MKYSMRPQEEPDESLKGEQSARSDWRLDGRNGKYVRNTTRPCRDESLDPVFSIRGNMRTIDNTESSDKTGKTSKTSKVSKIDENGSKSFSDEESPTSTCCFCFEVEDDSFLGKYKKFMCIGVIIFLLIDAILLGIFLSPISPTSKDNNSLSTGGDENGPGNPTAPVTEPNSSPTATPGTIIQTELGNYELLETVPHDVEASTQGLEVLSLGKIELMKEQRGATNQEFVGKYRIDSYTIESTGNLGESTLRIVELATGEVVREFSLVDEFFGEGCTYFYDENAGKVRIVQITYEQGIGFVYDLTLPTREVPEWSFNPVGDFDFSEQTTRQEGWGIVYHPLRDQFIVSDGSAQLHFWKLTEEVSFTYIDDTQYITTFRFDLVGKVTVKQNRDAATMPSNWTRVPQLNELEWDPHSYDGNTILANIHKSDEIVRIWVGGEADKNNNDFASDSINPDIGRVSHVYDLSILSRFANPSGRKQNVLNGIAFAYESDTVTVPVGFENDFPENEFWVTGKYWPSMYRIRLRDD